jgi:predicted nucleic acid-binding protein
MTIVCDSSPIIALSGCDCLYLLDELFECVVIPQAVYNELTVIDKPEATNIFVWAQDKMIRKAENQPLLDALNFTLGMGESEAIALYREKSADYVLIDEKKGRRIAKLSGINVVGSLGILVFAKRRGLITAVKPRIKTMQTSGIRISDDLCRETLILAGE